MTNLRSGALRFVLIAVGVLLVFVLGFIVRQRYGIRVDIRNQSVETLARPRLKVECFGRQGKDYILPDLPAGAHARVYVQPLTESSISLEFADAKGIVHIETIVGYAEGGYCGTAMSTISSEKKVHSISTLGCWKSWFDFI